MALSVDAERELREIDQALIRLAQASSSVEDHWRELRRFAAKAAEAMGRENTSWHGLVRRYPDVLP
jgi:hypothetical protein